MALRHPARTSLALGLLLVAAVAAGCADAPVSPGQPAGSAPGAPDSSAAPAAPAPPPGPPAPATLATPPASPPATTDPAGRTVPLGPGTLRSLVAAPDAVGAVAALSGPGTLVQIDPDTAAVTRRSALTVTPGQLGVTPDRQGLLVPDAAGTTVPSVVLPAGTTGQTLIRSGTRPRTTLVTPSGDVLVASAGSGDGLDGTVTVVRDGRIVQTLAGVGRPAALAAFGTTAAVLDTAANTVRLFDTGTYEPSGELPAGTGPTAITIDRHGRLLVTDTRAGALLVNDLTAQPARSVARVDLAGAGPYATAYDASLDRLWVTLTARNEVVGYDLSGDEPRELLRLPTVRQPDLVAAASGRLYVGGTADSVLQILAP